MFRTVLRQKPGCLVSLECNSSCCVKQSWWYLYDSGIVICILYNMSLYPVVLLELKIGWADLAGQYCHTFGGINVHIIFRSEQDKEPEQETVSENVGPGASEESAAEGMPFSLRDYGVYDLVIV